MKQEQSLVNRIISIDNRLFIITATKIEIICELWPKIPQKKKSTYKIFVSACIVDQTGLEPVTSRL